MANTRKPPIQTEEQKRAAEKKQRDENLMPKVKILSKTSIITIGVIALLVIAAAVTIGVLAGLTGGAAVAPIAGIMGATAPAWAPYVVAGVIGIAAMIGVGGFIAKKKKNAEMIKNLRQAVKHDVADNRHTPTQSPTVKNQKSFPNLFATFASKFSSTKKKKDDKEIELGTVKSPSHNFTISATATPKASANTIQTPHATTDSAHTTSASPNTTSPSASTFKDVPINLKLKYHSATVIAHVTRTTETSSQLTVSKSDIENLMNRGIKSKLFHNDEATTLRMALAKKMVDAVLEPLKTQSTTQLAVTATLTPQYEKLAPYIKAYCKNLNPICTCNLTNQFGEEIKLEEKQIATASKKIDKAEKITGILVPSQHQP